MWRQEYTQVQDASYSSSSEYRLFEIEDVDPLGRLIVGAATVIDQESPPDPTAVDQTTFDSYAAYERKACRRFTTNNHQEMALHVRYTYQELTSVVTSQETESQKRAEPAV